MVLGVLLIIFKTLYIHTIESVNITFINIKRVDAIGVASTLGNKTIRTRLFIYFFDTCIIYI
jgi:hypothetical protein